MPDIEFSVIIPLFNEEGSLFFLQKELDKVMEELSSEYEIIYIDDGSTDSSLAVLEKLKKTFPKIKIISFKNNNGQSAALLAGFKESNAKWIITLDADLQNPPHEIFKLVSLRQDFDFIGGIRTNRKDNFLKITASSVARFFRWLILGDTTTDIGCSLRVFKKEILDVLPCFNNFHRFFTFLVKTKGFSIKEVPVDHRPRRFGKTKYAILEKARTGIFDLRTVVRIKKHHATKGHFPLDI